MIEKNYQLNLVNNSSEINTIIRAIIMIIIIIIIITCRIVDFAVLQDQRLKIKKKKKKMKRETST